MLYYHTGAAGVVLYPEVAEDLKSLIDTAHAHNIGTIILCILLHYV